MADAFDVTVIGASAGGVAATATVLATVPRGFPVALLLMLHLAPDSAIVAVYEGLPLPVEWVEDGSVLRPGVLLVCPPKSFVELLPDGTCRLAPCEGGALERPIDRLFESTARSFGPRAIGLILTGMGNDGAAGARALHAAGGRGVVQSLESAEFPSMPGAAIAGGAADLIVPLEEIGPLLADIVSGTPRTRMRAEIAAVEAVFGGPGIARARLREIDWSMTALGPVMSWPAWRKSLVRTALASRLQQAQFWGRELLTIGNDAYLALLGDGRQVQGRRADEVWHEAWERMGPALEGVLRTGESRQQDDTFWPLHRHGFVEEAYFTCAWTPLHDDGDAVVGVLSTFAETTARVLADRRIRTLGRLGETASAASTRHEACARAVTALADSAKDLPAVLIYLLDGPRHQANLAAASGVQPGAPAAPYWIDLRADDAAWPVGRALAGDTVVRVEDLGGRVPALTAGPWPEPVRIGMVLPLRPVSGGPAAGALVVACSPRLTVDGAYQAFVGLVAARIAASLAEADARASERERLDRLAELDQAKNEFFANVSHEFRTPLTLLLPPLESLLRQRTLLPEEVRREVDVAARNARRLLALVNDLLDFSQIEARRQRASLEAVDLGAATAEVAGVFRSAIEAAGLSLRIDCDPRLPPVPVHPQMWERVVSNLLSNAFKFTFEGGISVSLHALSLHAELVVADTGVGIAPAELANVFKRFHRVRGTRARTAEGSGIGLALVDDLVRRMGGQVRVQSREGHGTEFTIWMPYKPWRGALQTDPVKEAAASVAPRHAAAMLASEARRWVDDTCSDAPEAPEGVVDDLLGPAADLSVPAAAADRKDAGLIVVADDNADMRQYLRRLLAPRWRVELATDGVAALAAVRRMRPDLLVADVMMPNLDGFELLRQLREDPAVKTTPVVLVTARAGEEAAIEGLRAGADDYIAKPFSPREFVARVRAVLERSRIEAALQARNEELERFNRTTAAAGKVPPAAGTGSAQPSERAGPTAGRRRRSSGMIPAQAGPRRCR